MKKSWMASGSARRCLALGLLASAVILTGDRAAFARPLEETVQLALETNPEVGVVQADREAIEQELRQARALRFPSLDARAAAGPEYTNSPGTRNRTTRPPGGDASTTLLRLESQLTLTQMLFDGFETRSEIDRQFARLDSAARRVREASEFIALDAIEAHLDVLRNQVLVELAEQNVADHQRILGQVRELERVGGGTIADVRQTEARVAAAETSLATAMGNLRDAQARYIAVVGLPAEDLLDPAAPFIALPESAEAAADRASFSNPTVLIANADIEAAKAELTGAQAAYYPRLDLEAGVGANENLDGIRGGNVDAQALVVLRYNLFRGGADVAREREAYFRIKQARETLRNVRRSAEEEARISYNALRTAQARVEALRGQAEATRATRDAYAQQFDLGQRSLLDLLDSENELFIARTNLVTGEVTEVFAVYRVLAVIGDLLMVMDIDPPKEAVNIFRERMEPIQELAPEEIVPPDPQPWRRR